MRTCIEHGNVRTCIEHGNVRTCIEHGNVRPFIEDAHGASRMLIDHPLLGPRDAREFTVKGAADLLARPDPAAPDAVDAFHRYLHLRDNPAGEMRELWYHEHGDRSWLVVTRDTRTHAVTRVELARDAARAAREGAR